MMEWRLLTSNSSRPYWTKRTRRIGIEAVRPDEGRDDAMETVKFSQMKDGDREDYTFLTQHETDFAAKTLDRLLDFG
jgi:hypothetical protein